MTTLAKDFHRLLKRIDTISDNQASVVDWDEHALDRFTVVIRPTGGLYAGGTFRFKITIIGDTYPSEIAPAIWCETNIYHPNIDPEIHQCSNTGTNVCCNIFDRGTWNPIFGLEGVVLGLIFLLYQPNIDDLFSPYFEDVPEEDEFIENVHRYMMGQDPVDVGKVPFNIDFGLGDKETGDICTMDEDVRVGEISEHDDSKDDSDIGMDEVKISVDDTCGELGAVGVTCEQGEEKDDSEIRMKEDKNSVDRMYSELGDNDDRDMCLEDADIDVADNDNHNVCIDEEDVNGVDKLELHLTEDTEEVLGDNVDCDSGNIQSVVNNIEINAASNDMTDEYILKALNERDERIYRDIVDKSVAELDDNRVNLERDVIDISKGVTEHMDNSSQRSRLDETNNECIAIMYVDGDFVMLQVDEATNDNMRNSMHERDEMRYFTDTDIEAEIYVPGVEHDITCKEDEPLNDQSLTVDRTSRTIKLLDVAERVCVYFKRMYIHVLSYLHK